MTSRNPRKCREAVRSAIHPSGYSVMISSPSGRPTILVFWCQISLQHSKGFPRAGPQTRVGWENSATF